MLHMCDFRPLAVARTLQSVLKTRKKGSGLGNTTEGQAPAVFKLGVPPTQVGFGRESVRMPFLYTRRSQRRRSRAHLADRVCRIPALRCRLWIHAGERGAPPPPRSGPVFIPVVGIARFSRRIGPRRVGRSACIRGCRKFLGVDVAPRPGSYSQRAQRAVFDTRFLRCANSGSARPLFPCRHRSARSAVRPVVSCQQ